MEYFLRILKGIVIGIVNIIPGVSSSTMAVIFDVYDDIIFTFSLDIKYIFKKFWKIIALIVGIIVGMIGFSFIIKYLLNNYYSSTMYLFVGMIIGSIPLFYLRSKSLSETSKPWIKWVVFGICFAIMIVLSVINISDNSVAITTIDWLSFFKIFTFSMLGAIGMILPGISGSLIMMLLGVYNTFVTAISDFNFVIIIPLALGSLVGMYLGSLLLKTLMKKYPKISYYGILALIIGSIIAIFPGIRTGWAILADIASMLVGGLIAFLITIKEINKIKKQKITA